MRKIGLLIRYLWLFFWGNVFSLFLYKKKYLRSKYFKGKYFGITAVGWGWIVRDFYGRLFFGSNHGIPFPVSPNIVVTGYQNITFDPDDLIIFQNFGNYYQAFGNGKITIGKGTWIAPNVGIITTNHDIHNPDLHVPSKDIVIGEKCWIGMNAVILPGVALGNNTTVGAGAVVTKSFLEGNCIIAGNPATVIKTWQIKNA